MNTPTPSASGAHTRIQLKRPGFVIVIHATLASFDPTTGDFTAWLDTDPQGASAGLYIVVPGGPLYADSNGLTWEVVR